VYFYDTTARPWAIVASDGLGVSDLNHENPDKANDDTFNHRVVPWAEDLDVISLIETWARWAKECTRR
jgi:hypothetical protein